MIYSDITRKERTLSGVLALVMHLLFLALLVFGVSWQQKRSSSAFVVDLWSSLPPLKQPKFEAPPQDVKPEPEPPKPAPRVEPKPEPKPVVKPDIALKEKLEKERRRKELEREKEVEKKKELEKKRELEKKKELEKVAAERRAKEKRAREEKARIAKEQDEALKRLAQQQAAQTAAQTKLMDDYMNGIRERIKRYVVVPPNMPGNPEAQFDVIQIPGGEVLSVKLKRSSGVPAYDAAVERAILKAQPLPPPPAGMSFSDVRELNLKFRPKE